MSASPDIAETHISLLFFVGERVYKLRKPVDLGFVDFRERAARQADCAREVALNRRLAPDVYLGVADLGLNGEPIDHMVVMRRMPAERRLAALVAMAVSGAGVDEWLGRVAATLVSFHRGAQRSTEISAAATAQALTAGWEDNFAQTAAFVGPVLDPAVDRDIRTLALRWLDGREPLLRSRIAEGRVCDGHGDLQAEDIFCLDDGVRILDCVEFSDVLRYCDVSADVAFLAMDLERLGDPGAAAGFVVAYRELAGDPFPESLLHHYCASRAYVRAKVSCLRAAQGAEAARDTARRLHDLALSYLRRARVALVLVGGLPGSGKSTLARRLAERSEFVVLHSDEIRRGSSDPTSEAAPAYGAGRYSESTTGAVYAEMLGRAAELVGLGRSVVLDASWVDQRRRAAALTVARRTSSDLVELCCDVAPEVARARILSRASGHADLSEATPEVRAHMAAGMDPWPSATVVETSGEPAEVLARALEILDTR
jgi:aminoglycoside phosphotransferase family enzyme/predicted kinase